MTDATDIQRFNLFATPEGDAGGELVGYGVEFPDGRLSVTFSSLDDRLGVEPYRDRLGRDSLTWWPWNLPDMAACRAVIKQFSETEYSDVWSERID